MKEVFISINKPHTDNIKALIKEIEVRKDRPNQPKPFPVYIYETKNKGGCGKVIGEFVCDKVEQFTVGSLGCDDIMKQAHLRYSELIDYFYKKDGSKDCEVRYGFAWHISNLVIYDKPKELKDFYKWCNEYEKDEPYCVDCDYEDTDYTSIPPSFGCKCDGFKPLTRPPQSWQYVEVEE